MYDQEMVHYPPPPCQVSLWDQSTHSVQGQVYPPINCKKMMIIK